MQIVEKKQVFWDKFFFRKPVKVGKLCNPLNLTTDSRITLEFPEFEGMVFAVDEVIEYESKYWRQSAESAVYDLSAVDPKDTSKIIHVRLWVQPLANAKAELGQDCKIIVLTKDHEEGYSKELEEFVLDCQETGKWIVNDDEDENGVPRYTAEYERYSNIGEAYKAVTRKSPHPISEEILHIDGIDAGAVKYWDYIRTVETVVGDASTAYTEYYIVEEDGQDGYFTMWIGREAIPSQVKVF